MPTSDCGLNPCDRDPRRWCACMRAAESELLARGIFNSHRRWHDMRRKRAMAIFNAKGKQ